MPQVQPVPMPSLWVRFKKSFRNSETICFARLQTAAGIVVPVIIYVLHALMSVDLSSFFTDPRFLVIWTIASGILLELLRRHREDWDEYSDGDNPDMGSEHPDRTRS